MSDYKGLSIRLLNAAQSYEAYQVGGEFADMLTDAARAIDDLTVALAASNEVIAKASRAGFPSRRGCRMVRTFSFATMTAR